MLVGRRFIAGRQALGVEFDIRNALYAHLLRLSWGFYDRHQTGQLMSRATVDLQQVRFFLGYGLIFFGQHILTIVATTAILFALDWQLALIALAITPVLVAVAYLYSRASHPILRDVQQRMADMTTVAEENIVGVNVVKAFAQEAREEREVRRRATRRVFAQSIEATRQRAFYVPLLSFLPLLAQAAVLLAGGHRSSTATSRSAQFVAFNVYVLMLVMPLRMLGMWIGTSQRAVASGERIFEVLDEPEEVVDKPDAQAAPGRTRATSASTTSPSATTPSARCCTTSTSTIEAGRTVALIGHTGSGKTTLDHARAALLRRAAEARPPRRRRRARPAARRPAPRDRDRLAGPVPLLDDGAREHRLRRARRDRRGGRARRADGAGARLRRRSSRTATTR